LKPLPLVKRQALLARVVYGSGIRFAAPLEGSVAALTAAVRQHGLEGIVAKRRDVIYECGKRSDSWQKLPLKPKDEFFIGAYRFDGWRLGILLVGCLKETNLCLRATCTQVLNRRIADPCSSCCSLCAWRTVPLRTYRRRGRAIGAKASRPMRWRVIAGCGRRRSRRLSVQSGQRGGVLRHAEFEGLV
jgi:hypothetical protein